MNSSTQIREILNILSDGKFHSGQEIGTKLGLSRSTIWKILKKLDQKGINVNALPKRGYQIPNGLELLEADLIINTIDTHNINRLTKIEILDQIPSTNSYLSSNPAFLSGSVCLAEEQTAGRGRQGKKWYSPFGSNIYLSLLWTFSNGINSLTGLSLAAAVALIKSLHIYGLSDLGIKWPNDIMHNQRKLAGILIDINGDLVGHCNVIIGLGLNLNMSTKKNIDIDQPWTDVQTLIKSKPMRNHLCGLILNELITMLTVFEKEGFSSYKLEWSKYDLLKGKTVTAISNNKVISGTGEGVDEKGNLILRCGSHIESITGGDVSVRLIKANS